MDGGSCQQVCFPCLPKFPTPATTSPDACPEPAPEPTRRQPVDLPHRGALRPAPADPDQEIDQDETCPVCQAVVLPTDTQCSQCGLQRAFATDPSSPSSHDTSRESNSSGIVQDARVATSCRKGAQHIPSPSVLNSSRKIRLHHNSGQLAGSRDVDAAVGARNWWHRGALVPPPYLEAPAPDSKKRPLANTDRVEASRTQPRKKQKRTTRRACPSAALNPRTAALAKAPKTKPAGRRGRKRKARPVDQKGAAAAAARTDEDQSLPAGPGPPLSRRRLLSPSSRAEPKAEGQGPETSAATGPAEVPPQVSNLSPAQSRLAQLLLRVRAKQASNSGG